MLNVRHKMTIKSILCEKDCLKIRQGHIMKCPSERYSNNLKFCMKACIDNELQNNLHRVSIFKTLSFPLSGIRKF